MWILRFAVLAIVLHASAARADEWVTPSPITVVSPDRRVQAVIAPAVDGKSGARVTIGKDSFTLGSRWMPVDALVFDDGSLLTLDDWHALGYGKVATVYERGGAVRWSKTLVELLGQPFVDPEAIRIDEQLLAYFEKMGSAFATYVTSTRAELTRLRAKR
jgi:hypothetical protein